MLDGTDWKDHCDDCDPLFSNQAPLNIMTNTSVAFNYKFYMFPIKSQSNRGNIQLENFRNNLVLNAENSFGNITVNLNDSDSSRIIEVIVICKKIYFRLPGEHVIDGLKYNMEIQIRCNSKVNIVKNRMNKVMMWTFFSLFL